MVGPISWEGNCRTCGQTNLIENIMGIATETGLPYARWLRGMERFTQRKRLDMTRKTA